MQVSNQCICPLCNMDLGGYHNLAEICDHIYHAHLTKEKNVRDEFITKGEYRYCLCGEWVVNSGDDLKKHVERKHNGELSWMYDAFHQQMLGVEP